MLNVKKIGVLLLAGLLTTSMAACGGGKAESAKDSSTADKDASSQGSAAEDQKTVTWFTESMDDVATANFQKYTLDPLATALPNIHIDWKPTADWNATLKVQMAAGDGPDLMNMDGPTVSAEYAAAGRLLELDSYAEKYGWSDIVFNWALNSCKAGGKLMAMPASYEGLVMYYRNDIFEENGWEIPKTAEELETVMKAAKEKGLVPVAFGSSDFKGCNEWWFSASLSCYAGPENVKAVLKGEKKWTDPEIKGAFQQLVDWWQAGYVSNSDSQAVSMDDAIALFAQGIAPMKMSGTWDYTNLKNLYDDVDWSLGIMPSLKDGVNQTVPLALGAVWAINKTTDVPDECAAILNQLYTGKDNMMKSIEEANSQPLPVEIDTSAFSDKMDKRNIELLNLLNDAQKAGNVGFCSWTFWPVETRNYQIDNLDSVFLGELSLDDYLAKSQELFDKELAAGSVPQLP